MPDLTIVPAAEKKEREINDKVVSLLRTFLERAERGELTFVSLVFVDEQSGEGGWASSATTLAKHEVLGYFELLKHGVLTSF